MCDDDWKDPAAYAHLQRAGLGGLAWAFLRRNPAYRSAYATESDKPRSQPPERWGLFGFVDPAAGDNTPAVFWRPDVDPRMLIVHAAASDGMATVAFDPGDWPGSLQVDEDLAGVRYRLRIDAEEHRFVAAAPLRPGQTISLVEPLDRWMAIRALAAQRLFRRLQRPAQPPRCRPLHPVVRRAITLLRALDARTAGASQRAIGEVLLGFAPTGPKAWDDSAERKRIARLLQGASTVAAGGYRTLLSRPIDL